MAVSERTRARFEASVSAHLDDAYNFARRLVGNGADAEDVVQDAALRALKALERQEIERPRAWFLTIVRNCAHSFLARSRHANVTLVDDMDTLDETAALAALSAEDLEGAIIAAQDREAVQRAIDGLPIAMREAIVLRDINGLSYKEVAEAIGAPIGTVMSRLARARAALAQALQGSR